MFAERGELRSGPLAEARTDGGLDDSAFAQPSGLACHGDTLFVADSESNVIRAVDLPPVNTVRTLAGGDLFEFGDADGVGEAARFQHPLEVAYHDGALYVQVRTTTASSDSIWRRVA
ncbi:MAG: hypothetical protein O3A25_04320 [Acidobacteria bacterium]|nr:hypothetical protein [Acidobacteriota bacterium]